VNFSPIHRAFRKAAHSHAIYRVEEGQLKPLARFNGLKSGGLSQLNKDVKTPFEICSQTPRGLSRSYEPRGAARLFQRLKTKTA
jgi:hypothetical protein